MRMISRALLGGSAIVALSASAALSADCPPVTVKDMQGMSSAYPHQFELAEFQAAGGCTVSFQENPSIAELNGKISGNPATLPAVADRLPAEPLVTAPFDEIGSYGGVLRGLSKATESGTSDLLSIRHVNFVRYSDDLKTVVPNIAKAWTWNDDFTVLTVTLRKGHKWSDGASFTAEDVVFWYEDLILNDQIYPETPSALALRWQSHEGRGAGRCDGQDDLPGSDARYREPLRRGLRPAVPAEALPLEDAHQVQSESR